MILLPNASQETYITKDSMTAGVLSVSYDFVVRWFLCGNQRFFVLGKGQTGLRQGITDCRRRCLFRNQKTEETNMKKVLASLLALVLCLSVTLVPALAEGILLISPAPSDGAEVYVTISRMGELVAAQAAVFVTDIDEDGVLTVNDALCCAHESLYEGGAESGYAAVDSDWGVSLTMLWGDVSGNYGYWLNNESCWSLNDVVDDGDYLTAFVYADAETWSDAYSYFNMNAAEVAVGDVLELTLTYNSGYDADWNFLYAPCAGAVVTDGSSEYVSDDNGKVSVSFDKAGTYTLTASSESATLVPPVCTVTVRSFADIMDSWAVDEIERVIALGLFSGTDKGFEPAVAMDRGMLVTVLYRLEGAPAVASGSGFADVSADAYYADPVAWASAGNIVTGYDENTFAPSDKITREQMATILWRYARYKGYDVSVGEDVNILSYTDAQEVSEYAVSAMQWACGAGIISGTSVDTLSPAANATREQVAVILDRFAASVD